MTIEQAFGTAIRRLRKVSGLSQEGLALTSKLDRVFISLIECGRKNPTLVSIYQLAKGLGVSMERVLCEVEIVMTLGGCRPPIQDAEEWPHKSNCYDADQINDIIAKYELAGNETVLLVEDEPATREYLEKVLTRVGYKVLVASDAHQAAIIYKDKKRTIALVVMDVVLPGGDGIEVVSRIRVVNPLARVLFMSGYEPARLGLPEDGTSFLLKPFDPLDLCNKVRECLNQ